jgi:hypothetical protein
MANARQNRHLPPPPVFGLSRAANEDLNTSNSGSICLDDIFDEFLFAGDRSTVNTSTTSKVFERYGSNDDDFDDDTDEGSGDEDSKKIKRPRNQHRNMSEQQKVERR